ncbi:unnamed protein product [Penicillium camemberti]|uniref:Str. FM013 n=1 Tax=Penicillium camemberti (strain FM 013) TaxID=1429867 RepID=A0A0G4P3K6_PENC3|nr:unnamed protein product [Penicillium camemberti]
MKKKWTRVVHPGRMSWSFATRTITEAARQLNSYGFLFYKTSVSLNKLRQKPDDIA